MSYVDKILQDEIVIAPYCGPQPAYERNGVSYPNRITEEQYKLLKACGVNVVYGHEDLMNSPWEHQAFEALDICEKLGMVYFVRDTITYEYCNVGEGKKMYTELTDEEKADLDRRYEASLRKYKDHPAFGGVMFIDEPGSANFPGIKAGKDVFDRVCPGKRFYVNLFPMYTSAYQLQYGWAKKGAETDPEYQVYVHTNLDRFKHHFKQFLEIVDPDIVSYDAYPFARLRDAKNSVHRVLWDMTQYVTSECRKHGKEYWHFLQVGGRWCRDMGIRITSMAEVNLGISVALGYGAKALELYTGCFPNCCIGGIEHSGLIDEFGKITEQYPLHQYAFMQVKAIEKHLVHAKLQGMIVSDAPYYGLLPSHEEIRRMEDLDKGAGDTIFEGTLLPDEKDGNCQISEYKALKGISSTTQCIVSCFDNEEETVYFVWNNSPYAASDVTLHFDDEYVFEHTQRTVTDRSEGKDLTIHALPAGENALVRIVSKK